ncbi:MAG TPA: carboxymuconolactone decarboxylase family protein, partial [Casimicrobiaceae bacterium]|nr:carboxymuconolactone decarboxylase family protein [Casimicrobiaceae bacterium]
MPARIDYTTAAPGAYAALRALETYLHQSGLEARLLELVKTRVSQINGCAFCIDMHTQMARVAG